LKILFRIPMQNEGVEGNGPDSPIRRHPDRAGVNPDNYRALNHLDHHEQLMSWVLESSYAKAGEYGNSLKERDDR
jgi:hypothetical protein